MPVKTFVPFTPAARSYDYSVLRRQLGEGDHEPEPDPVTVALMTPDDAAPDWSLLAAALRERPVWHAQAACRGEDINAFFGSERARVPDAVVELCSGCPVRVDCLSWATEQDEAGTWAGTTQRERRRARRQVA